MAVMAHASQGVQSHRRRVGMGRVQHGRLIALARSLIRRWDLHSDTEAAVMSAVELDAFATTGTSPPEVA